MRCDAAREAHGVGAEASSRWGARCCSPAAPPAGRSGEAAARGGNWDAAVEYYRLAVQDAPDRPEYRIALERAMLAAARAHLAAARELEAAVDLSGALIEYRQSYALDPSNGEAGVQIANLQQELRERIAAARAPAPIEAMRAQARQETAPPLLDPTSRPDDRSGRCHRAPSRKGRPMPERHRIGICTLCAPYASRRHGSENPDVRS